MRSSQQYDDAVSFRQALEDRLRKRALNQGEDLQRLRQQVAFDRFVTRIQHGGVNKWILKGGHALELAIGSARATRDIDLALNTSLVRGSDNHETLQRMLQQAASRSADDWLEFQVGESMMDLGGPLYGGERFPVRSMLGGRPFVTFHVDVAVGDVLLEPLRVTTGEDWFGFAGIEASPLTTTSLEQQFAEKLHAYTMPRAGMRDNSRVKDLVAWYCSLKWGALNLKVSRQQCWRRSATETLIRFQRDSRIHQVPGEGRTRFWLHRAALMSTLISLSPASETTIDVLSP